MRITDPVKRKKTKDRQPRWWDSPPGESREMILQLRLEQQSQRAPAVAAQPAPVTQKPQQSPKIDRLTLYQLAKPVLVGCHDESLLKPISSQVKVVREHGIEIYAVPKLEGLLVAIVGEVQASFQIGGDIWIDFSQITRIAKSLNLPAGDVAEAVLCHEAGHVFEKSELLAWADALGLWRKIGRSSEESFRKVCSFCLNSYL